MSIVDKGLFIPVRLTDKVRITTNDTTADYLDNKIVPGSRIGKNILNPLGNEELQIVVAEVGGVWLATSLNSGYISVSTINYYQSPGGNSTVGGASVLGALQMRLPRDVTLTAMYVYVDAGPAAGQTATCQFNVDGSPDDTIKVILTEGDKLKGATGELCLNQDQKLTLQWSFTGGMASISVRSVTIAYRVLIES